MTCSVFSNPKIIVEEVAQRSQFPLLRRQKPTDPKKEAKWTRELNRFCDLVQGLTAPDCLELDRRQLEKVRDRLDRISQNVPKGWLFKSPEQKRLDQAKCALDQVLAPDATYKALHPTEPVMVASTPIPKLSKLGAALCLLATQAAPQLPQPSFASETPAARVQNCIELASGKSPAKVAALRARAEDLLEQIQSNRSPVREIWPDTSDEQCKTVDQLEKELQAAMQEARSDLILRQELNQFGNKHKNLILMEGVVNALGVDGLHIPTPQGVSTDEVHAFLQKNAPEVFEHWEAMGKLKGIEPFFENPEVKAHFEAIDRAIEKAFAEGFTFSPEMKKWIEGLKGYLMVRSTGAEDTDQLANAGGNLSKAYVPADLQEVSAALGAVVRSYFGKGSLQNRLNAGMNPFEEELRLAVTMQELIGEEIGGSKEVNQIPISFVLFTNEPLYYIGGEKFRAMRISASYGHGEGVVSSQGIATDTALILQSESQPDELYVLYDNQKKLERLAPTQQGEKVRLSKLLNPESLQTRPALLREQLLKLYHSGVLMESFYQDHPTDIEGVVKGNQIYFVQARPVNRKPLLPTYLDLSQKPLATVQAEMIVPGKASVVTLTHKDQVLSRAPTLEAAQDLYDANKHKLIIVTQKEPDNSHPVVNFSGLGVSCLYASSDKEVDELLNRLDEQHPVAACMQTAALHLWDQNTAPLDDHIKTGFAVHPAKMGISMPIPSYRTTPVEAPQELKDLLLKLKVASREEALELLRGLKTRVGETLPPESTHPEIAGRYEALQSIRKTLSHAIRETEAVFKSRREPRLKQLLHLKVLDQLFLGNKPSNRIGQYSFLDIPSLTESIQLLSEYHNQVEEPRCMDLLLYASPANKEAFETWKQLLFKWEKSGDQQLQEFKEFVSILKETGAFPLWLTFFRTLPLEQTDNGLIHTYRKELQGLEISRNGLDRFADPKTAFQARAELFEQLKPYTSSEWIEQIKKASSITKMIGYRSLEQAIDVLDLAIKSIAGSRQFQNDEEKIKLFKEMLKFSFQLVRNISLNLVPREKLFVRVNAGETNNQLVEYFGQIESILDALPENNISQLLTSPDFSVSAAQLESGAVFERHLPVRGGDVHTLLHQNGLVDINVLNQELLNPDQIAYSALPQNVKSAMAVIETGNEAQNIQRIGIEETEQEIVVRYNVPLRNHSGHLDLSYDIATGKMKLRGQLLGDARTRWPQTAEWVQVLQEAGLFPAAQPISQGGQELTFGWFVDQDTLIQAKNEYVAMARYSMGGAEDIYLNSYPRWKAQNQLDPLADLLFKTPRSSANSFYEEYLRDPKNRTEPKIQRFLESAKEAFYKQSTNLGALAVFESLIKANLAIKEIIKIAKTGFHSENMIVPFSACELFQTLIRNDKAYKVAEEIATVGMYSKDVDVQQRSLDLFIALILKGQAYEAALSAANVGIESNDANILDHSLRLFDHLVNQGRALEPAIAAATVGMKNPVTQSRALEIFRSALSQGRIETVMAVATHGMNSNDPLILQTSLQIFDLFVRGGLAYEAAEATALVGMNNNADVLRYSLQLFNTLVDKGQAYQTAEAAAIAGMKSSDDNVLRRSLMLFENLIAEGHAYQSATVTATDGMKNNNPIVLWSSLELFDFLVTKNQAYEEAEVAATVGMNSNNANVVEQSLRLFRSLVENDQAYEAAKAASILADKPAGNNREVQLQALQLSQLLNQKKWPRGIWNWNFRNPENQISAFALAAGAATLGVAAKISKKIANLNPQTVFKTGIGIGVTMAFMTTFQAYASQPASVIGIGGMTMGATGIASLAIAGVKKLHSRMKKTP